MQDLISRQAAIDALDVLCQEHRYKIPGKIETYSQYNEAWQDALDRAEGVIFNLPSAQPEQRWIPVTERLPENGHYYLWCSNGGNVQSDYYWDGFENGQKYGYTIVAWMPLPEPYKGEQG